MGQKSKEVKELAELIHKMLDEHQGFNVRPLMFSSIEDKISIPATINNTTKKLVITIEKVK